jgi:cell division protein FtsX
MTRQQFAKLSAVVAIAVCLIALGASIMRSRSLSSIGSQLENVRAQQESVRVQQAGIQARIDAITKEKPTTDASEIKTRRDRLNELQKDLEAVVLKNKALQRDLESVTEQNKITKDRMK